VKAVQLRRTKRGVELEKFASVPIHPNGPPSADTDLRSAKVSAIRRAVQESGITAKHCVSAVSGESIIVRYIQLPHMTEDELKNALRYEAEEYIPFQIDEVNLDSHILGTTDDGGGKRINVLLVAARKEQIADHIDLVKAAGLIPSIVDVDSFALFNTFEFSQAAAPGEVVVLVDIGSEITNINIFQDGLSHFARDINIGGTTITRAIQQKLRVDFSEAERLKHSEGVPFISAKEDMGADGDDESPLIESIQGAVDQMTGDDLGDDSLESQAGRVVKGALSTLLGEVQRSLQFFENQVSGQTVGRMILSGGTSRLPNLPQFIANELRVPVDVLDPIASISVGNKGVDQGLVENNRQMLGVGVGLALREVA